MARSKKVKAAEERQMTLREMLCEPFAECDAATRLRAEKLAVEAEFMAQTLEVLKADIAENGPVVTHINGNGFEVRQENPAQKSYNTMIKNYNAAISALAKMAEGAGGSAESKDKLMSFIGGGR